MAYDDIINAAARQNGLDPDYIRANMMTESSGNPNAVSGKKASGLMQLVPDTARELGVTDVFDPKQNIFGGAKYLRQLIDKYGDLDKATMAYNMGPSAFDQFQAGKRGLPTETANHVERVAANFAKIKGSSLMPQAQEPVDTSDPFMAAMQDRLQPKAAPAKAQTASFRTAAPEVDPNDPFMAAMQERLAPQAKAQTVAAQPQPASAAPQAQRGVLDELGRQIGLTARAGAFVASQGGIAKTAAPAPKANAQGMPAFITDASGQQIPNPDLPRKTPGAFTMGVGDTVRGAVQGLAHGIGYLAEKVAPESQLAKDFAAGVPQVDQQLRQQEQQYQAQRAAQGQTGFDWGRLGGGVAGTALIPNPVMAAMAQPVTEGDSFAMEKAKQGALGAALQGASKVVGKVISPNVRPEVQALISEGVTPTPGQIAGGWVQRLEDKARSIPGVGDMITSAQRRGVEDLNRAAYARALQGVPNAEIPKTVGREAVDDVAKQLGSAYDNLLGKMHFQADKQFLGDMAGIATNVRNLPPAQLNAYQSFLNDKILSQMTGHGRMGGENLKLVEGALSREAKQFSGSPDPFNQKLGQELQNTLQAFRNGIERSNPAHAPQLQKLNEGYANFARLRDAAGRVGAAEGVFSPAQLNSAVRAADKSVGKGSFARGNALMQDLSDAGVNVLGPKYPDSGTAGRIALWAGLTGGLAAVNPAALAGAAVAAAPYTAPGQRLAAALLTQRPAAAAPVGNFIQQYGPRLGAMLTPAALMATGQR